MFWLVLLFTSIIQLDSSRGASVSSSGNALHVGTFSKMADCQAAAAAATFKAGMGGQSVGYSFVCVSSGSLN